MADPADRRASERMPVTTATSCSYIGRVVDDVGPVKIRDVSMHGIGLVVSRTIPAGTMLVIGLSNKEKGISRTLMVKVAHVTPIPGGFLVGGTFAEPLTYQELTSLVM